MKKIKINCNTHSDNLQSGEEVSPSLPLVHFELYIQNEKVFNEEDLKKLKNRIREIAEIVTPGGDGINTNLKIY